MKIRAEKDDANQLTQRIHQKENNGLVALDSVLNTTKPDACSVETRCVASISVFITRGYYRKESAALDPQANTETSNISEN